MKRLGLISIWGTWYIFIIIIITIIIIVVVDVVVDPLQERSRTWQHQRQHSSPIFAVFWFRTLLTGIREDILTKLPQNTYDQL